MERAIQSGMIIAKKLSLPIYAHLDIHENGGLYLEDHATQEKTGTSGRSVNRPYRKHIPPSLCLKVLILRDGGAGRLKREKHAV